MEPFKARSASASRVMAREMLSWPSFRAWLNALRAGNVLPVIPSAAAAPASSTSAPSWRQGPRVGVGGGAHHDERMSPAEHPLEVAERGVGVARVDGVGEVPRRDTTGVAEEGLDVLGPDLGARAVRALEDPQQPRQ